MKLVTEAGPFAAALSLAGRAAVVRRSVIPILQCVLIDGRTVTGCNLDQSVFVPFPAEVAKGRMAIPFRSLHSIVRNLPVGATVTIESGRDGATLTHPRGRYILPTMPDGDFPVLSGDAPSRTEAIDGNALVKAIRFAGPAVSREETRYYLNGVFVAGPIEGGDRPLDGRHLVATDGRKLAMVPLAEWPDVLDGAIVPRDALPILAAMGPPTAVARDKDGLRATFMCPGGTLETKLIDGTYPNWRRVVPAAADGPKASFHRRDLIDAIRRLGVTDRWRGVLLRADDVRAWIARRDVDNGDAVERILGHGTIAASFDGRYLVEIARACRSDWLTISGDDVGAPHNIIGSDEIGSFVLMPMRADAWNDTFESLAQAIPTPTEPAPAMGEAA